MATPKLKLVTEAQGEQIANIVREWYRAGGKIMFEDASFTARAAVGEYIANQKGLTLYECKATVK